MKRALSIGMIVMAACLVRAEPVCVGDVCYPSREAALAAGVSAAELPAVQGAPRVGLGYMRPREFRAFLAGSPPASFGGLSVGMIVLMVLLGGLAANLTPCVLPLVPVNLAILLGRAETSRRNRFARGLAYGAGIAMAYGALGVAAALGGFAFGAVQSSPAFNLGVSVAFVVLALAMLDVVNLDAGAVWRRVCGGRPGAPAPRPSGRGTGGAFLLGAGAAVLAGACVEPILLATLLYTAEGFAAGRIWTVCLPFVLGAGMGLPWPFAAAGLSVLPRPGAWMRWVKRVFAAILAVLAVHYARLAFRAGGDTPVAETAAAGTARPRLYIVGAPWCKNCSAMERTTLRDPDVRADLQAYEVRRVEIDRFEDLEKYPDLAGLKVPGLPAYVVVPPAKK